MLSIPPATLTSLVPAMSRSCANIAAFIPEPHILFTVVQPADSGRPAPSDAWRAGACPCPAGSTQPMITSCTWSGLTPRIVPGQDHGRGTEADIRALRGQVGHELNVVRA